jgi:hypothetical protein
MGKKETKRRKEEDKQYKNQPGKKNYRNQQNLSIITLNVNGLNTPIKR